MLHEMTIHLLVLLVVVGAALIGYLLWQCYLTHLRAKRLDNLCRGMYKELKRTQSPQWAEDALKDIIHRVVNKVDSKTTSICRTS